ncbi:hypothetical protein Pyn_24529 [Prunus yedoensis var. nudiflora]|uniref:Uncharacterized protein n=1 Tax=Prunus yedoensis var. nudiflora TaxID=2094558 RepID=A0A314USS9_PRUYE|nr:hypothetical protein Pyn_24529 [Prunus yedoensis var. nudiflora]
MEGRETQTKSEGGEALRSRAAIRLCKSRSSSFFAQIVAQSQPRHRNRQRRHFGEGDSEERDRRSENGGCEGATPEQEDQALRLLGASSSAGVALGPFHFLFHARLRKWSFVVTLSSVKSEQ